MATGSTSIARPKPHRGFDILQRWAETLDSVSFVFTSNVDGQFQQAGFERDRVIECHGSISHLQCTEPCSNEIWSADDLDVEVDMESFRAVSELPACPHCGALARPNVLMFGDWHWIPGRTAAQEQRFSDWLADGGRPKARDRRTRRRLGGADGSNDLRADRRPVGCDPRPDQPTRASGAAWAHRTRAGCSGGVGRHR